MSTQKKNVLESTLNDKQKVLVFAGKAGLSLALVIYYCFIIQDLVDIFGTFFAKSSSIPATFAISVAVMLDAVAMIVFGVIFPSVMQRLTVMRSKLGVMRWIFSGLIASTIVWFFLYSKWSFVIDGKWLRSVYFVAGYLAIAWLLTKEKNKNFSIEGLLIAGLFFGALFQIANEMKTVVAYPFSLGWSEGNRIWDYSARLGKRFYNYPQELAIDAYIDLGRQTLWGLPFLLPKPTILLVRLWNAFLYTVPYFLFGLLVFSDKGQKKALWIGAGLWVFLFIHQGPIYTPLILAAMLTYTTKFLPTWSGFFIAILAGLFALYSRQTWMFAPAMWAALIAFVEKSPHGVRDEKGRWIRAIALGTGGILGGLVVGNLIVAIRARLAQDPSSVTGTVNLSAVNEMVSKQPLLWNRLLPNATNPLGILPALLLAVIPLILILIIIRRKIAWELNFWQKLLILGELAAFLGVGIIASVKIGGGDNLHNLDMFLITMVLLASLVWKVGGREFFENIGKQNWIIQAILLAAVLYPASQGMLSSMPIETATKAETKEALEIIQIMVDDRSPGEILFIDQRQLLTFNTIKNVKLVPEYEKKVLMDMAMANDAAYFDSFYEDLETHRFSLILSQPVYITYQDVEHAGGFGSENNTWVDWVSVPMLCHYEPVVTDTTAKFMLLVPRTGELPEDMIQWCEDHLDS